MVTPLPLTPETVPDSQPEVLPSRLIDDSAVPFPVTQWTTPSVPIPRFGDPQWRVEGLNPHPPGTEVLDFTTMTPEWSLIAREVIYWRCAGRDQLRDELPNGPLRRVGTQPRSATIRGILRSVRLLEAASAELRLGLPRDWDETDLTRLREWTRAECPDPTIGSAVSVLHRLRSHLTLGGILPDPMQGTNIYTWTGAARPSDGLRGSAAAPAVFVPLLRAALAYVDDYADDILHAKAWRDDIDAQWERGDVPKRPKRLPGDHPGVARGIRGPLNWEVEQFIEEHGALPAYTTSTTGDGGRGQVAFQTLGAVLDAPMLRASATTKQYIRSRLDDGVPLRLGMLPLPVADVKRADGTTGPWREEWCWSSIPNEVTALRDACAIIIVAFTGMRASEAQLLPKDGWRTTWYGHDAITAPLIKNAHGEPHKWWATDPVVHACELLEATSEPDATWLLTSNTERVPVVEDDDTKTTLGTALRRFVAHINTEESLLALEHIPAAYKWGKHQSRDGERLTPHQMRFTLASIGNTAALGDAALHSQLKHAKHAMTWGYMNNSGKDAWVDLLTGTAAIDGLALAIDLMAGVWSGMDEPAGPAGRKLARSTQAIIEEAGLPEYEPDSDDSLTDQFIAKVASAPTVLAFARAIAGDLHLGTVNHCWDNMATRACGGDEPLLAACFPERCVNMLITGDQIPIFQDLADEAETWAEQPNIPDAQRDLFTRRARRIRLQIGAQEGVD